MNITTAVTIYDALDDAYENGTDLILVLSDPVLAGQEGQVIGYLTWTGGLMNVLFTAEQVATMWDTYAEEAD